MSVPSILKIRLKQVRDFQCSKWLQPHRQFPASEYSDWKFTGSAVFLPVGWKVQPFLFYVIIVNHSCHMRSGWGCGQKFAGGFGAMIDVAALSFAGT